MYGAFAAVFPVFTLLLLGNWARRSGFLDDVFWTQAEKATYYILFPALLVFRLSQAELDWGAELWLILAAFLTSVTASVFCVLFQWFLRLENRDFTSFFQGGVRFNTYIGLALVAILPGDGLTLAALLLAVMIPVVNVLCVLVYELYSDASGVSWCKVLSGIVKNPLVVACVLGIMMNVFDLLPPGVFMDVLGKLGAMALPMGLLAVGAGLRLKALRGTGLVFLWSAVLKLTIIPLAALGITILLGVDGLSQAVLVIFAALPTASSAYILARQMGGNAELMAGMVTGQTLLSMVSLPLVLFLLVE